MADPTIFNHPNHYGARRKPVFIDGYSVDSGWVHVNSSVINHAYYLAIEGGVHKTSGKRVTGVGAARRAEIEQAFYRAFVYKLTRTSVMRHARFWTIHQAPTASARTALREAWDAVGVNDNQQVSVQTKDFTRSWCEFADGTVNSMVYWTTEIQTNHTGFEVNDMTLGMYDGGQDLIPRPGRGKNPYVIGKAEFREWFGSTYIPPYTKVESTIFWCNWPPSIWLQTDVNGKHTTGETRTHYSGRYWRR